MKTTNIATFATFIKNNFSTQKMDETESSAVSNLMQVSTLEKYLAKVCTVLLDTESDESFLKSLKQPDVQSLLKKFISESSTPTLLIQKNKEGNEMCTHFFFIFLLLRLLCPRQINVKNVF